jgi:hypothetical protein
MEKAALPDWPALMDTATACAYLSMGPSSLKFLTARAGVAPIDLDGVALLRWRRRDLDGLVDSLRQRGATFAPAAAPVVDLEAEALARAARRGRR